MPFLGLYMADQGSFKALITHMREALWYLFPLPPHVVATFLSMGRASHLPPKREILWEDGEELLPKFPAASCSGAGPPAGVPQELCIGEPPLGDAGNAGTPCKQTPLHSICSHQPLQE